MAIASAAGRVRLLMVARFRAVEALEIHRRSVVRAGRSSRGAPHGRPVMVMGQIGAARCGAPWKRSQKSMSSLRVSRVTGTYGVRSSSIMSTPSMPR